MSRSFSLAAAAILALAASQPARSEDKDSQYDDARNPHYKAAQQALDNNNATAAASEYEAALATNPELQDAQYQLGIIYAEKLQDPVSSIYHFRHYLAIAPNAEHAANAKDMIEKQKRIFAASVPSAPGEPDPATLKAENATLKKEVADAGHTIAQLQADLAATQKGTGSTPAAPTSSAAPEVAAQTNAAPSGPLKALPLDAPNPAIAAAADGTNAPTASGPSRSYTVVKGDSLWKIAHKMYPHDTLNGEDKIREANKEVFNGKFLQPGQVLVIPQ